MDAAFEAHGVLVPDASEGTGGDLEGDPDSARSDEDAKADAGSDEFADADPGLSAESSVDPAFAYEGTFGALRSGVTKAIYWNPSETPVKDPADDRVIAPAGSDLNTGASPQYPVLTWDRVKNIYETSTGFTVYVMTTAVLGRDKAATGDPIVPLNLSIDGVKDAIDYGVVLTTWDQNQEELFLVPNEDADGNSQAGTLSLANITLDSSTSGLNTVRVVGGMDDAGGQLDIGANVTMRGGVQIELEDGGRSLVAPSGGNPAVYNPVALTAAPRAGTVYQLYFSGANDSLLYQDANVVVSRGGPSDIKPYFQLSAANADAHWRFLYEGEALNPAAEGKWNRATLALHCDYAYTDVYLDPANGDDGNFGGTCKHAVKTIARAKELVGTAAWDTLDRTIRLCSALDVDADTALSMADVSLPEGARVRIAPCPSLDQERPHGVVDTLVRVRGGAELVLDHVELAFDQIVWQSANVRLEAGASLVMNEGAVLVGGTSDGGQPAVSPGVGVWMQGDGASETKFVMNGGEICYRGQGVFAQGDDGFVDKTSITLAGGSVHHNETYDHSHWSQTPTGALGGGLSLYSVSLVLDGADISYNKDSQLYNSYDYHSYGSGVYLDGDSSMTMKSGTVRYNEGDASQSGYGAGICIYGNAALNMTGGSIEGNSVSGKYCGGSGVYVSYNGSFTATGGSFLRNDGASIPSNGGGTGGSAVGVESGAHASMKGVEFNENGGSSGVVGALGSVDLSDCAFKANTAVSLFARNNANVSKCAFQNGEACAIDVSDGRVVVVDSRIEGNQGGGVRVSGGTCLLSAGTVIQGNTADNGGGIATSGGVTYMESGVTVRDNLLSDPAVGLGSNVFAEGTVYLLGGTYGHSTAEAGKHGVTVATMVGYGYGFFLNPGGVTFENDDLYLHTAASIVNNLDDSPGSKRFPLSANPDAFDVGSVIVAPASETVTNADGTSHVYQVDDVSGPAFFDVFQGGDLPRKATLMGYDQKLVLLGQGVYLDGSGGDDKNTGASPSQAVKSWSRAQEALREGIARANADADTFEPYVYVCGECAIDASTPERDRVWSLPWESEAAYVQQARAYDVDANWYPQVRRFAYYLGTMVNVNAGSFSMRQLTMDGMSDKMNPRDQWSDNAAAGGVDPSIWVKERGAVTLDVGARVVNGYQYGIRVSDGSLDMRGTAYVGANRYHQVLVETSLVGGGLAQATMRDRARIELSEPRGELAPARADRAGVSLSGSGDLHNAVLNMEGSSSIISKNRTGVLQDAYATLNMGANSTAAGFPFIAAEGYNDAAIRQGRASHVAMSGYAELRSTPNEYGYYESYGIRVDSGPDASDASQVVLEDHASLRELGYAYYSSRDARGCSFVLSGQAKIATCRNGIYLCPEGYGPVSEFRINLKDSASIEGTDYAIELTEPRQDIDGGHFVTLDGNASIADCKRPYRSAMTGTKLVINGNASITGSGPYEKHGDYGSGAICISGGWERRQSGESVVLNDGARVEGMPRAGISVEEQSAEHPVQTVEVALSGSASIVGNGGRGLDLGSQTVATVGAGTTIVGNGTDVSGVEALGKGIYSAGLLALDVGARIDEEVYLASIGKNVMLTDNASLGFAGVPEGSFTLGYRSSYLGERIIGPSTDIAGGANDTVPDASKYLKAFRNSANIPDGGTMCEGSGDDERYIVVKRSNNVYLAGDGSIPGVEPGDDANNGASPGSPVRTFARAKQVLADLDPGANIVVCNYGVDPSSATVPTDLGGGKDLDWSFGVDGTFSNAKNETWRPRVISDGAGEYMISVRNLADGEKLTLRGLTFDAQGRTPEEEGGLGRNAAVHVQSPAGQVLLEGCSLENLPRRLPRVVNAEGGNAAEVKVRDFELRGTSFDDPTYLFYFGSGTCELDNVKIEGNEFLTEYGGGSLISNNSANLLMRDCSISGNKIVVESDEFGMGDVHAAGIAVQSNGDTELIDCAMDGNVFEGHIPASTEHHGMGGMVYGDGVILNSYGKLVTSGSVSVSNNVFSCTAESEPRYVDFRGMVKMNGYGAVTGLAVAGNTVSLPFAAPDEQGEARYTVQGAGIYVNGRSGGMSYAFNDVTVADNVFTNAGGSVAGTVQETLGGGLYLDNEARVSFNGGSITGNKADRGSAVYLARNSTDEGIFSQLSLAGGVIAGNECADGSEARGDRAPVFVDSPGLSLKSARADVRDRIWLSSSEHFVTLTGALYQKNRLYQLDCNVVDPDPAKRFGKGSRVVVPDGEVLKTATSYYNYFAIESAGFVLSRQTPDLVLKQYVFLDGRNGDDSANGANPDTALRTFEGALSSVEARGGDVMNTVFYISGGMSVSDRRSWSLAASRDASGQLTSSVCRYTGFSLTGGNVWPAYKGSLVDVLPGGDLELSDCSLEGRRESDSFVGESLVRVREGGRLSLGAGASLSLNSVDRASGGKGGAVRNEGELVVGDGVTITAVEADKGAAVYQDGSMKVSGSPAVAGTVYLPGTGASAQDGGKNRVIEAAQGYRAPQGNPLSIDVQNPYGGREVVEYGDDYEPVTTDAEAYLLGTSTASLYRLGNRAGAANVLELQQKNAVYVDGAKGSDANSGSTPDDALKTVQQAYRIMKEAEKTDPNNNGGGVIMVVGTVDVNADLQLINTPGTALNKSLSQCVDQTGTLSTAGTVYVSRYVQPTAHATLSGYGHATHTGALFDVKGGATLEVKDVSFDGRSQAVGGSAAFESAGAQASAALIEVSEGVLDASYLEFKDNDNVSAGSQGGALLVGPKGKARLASVAVSNCRAEQGGGVYLAGELSMGYAMNVEAPIYLAGTGKSDASSSHVDIQYTGTTNGGNPFHIQMQNPFDQRMVAQLPEDATAEDYALFEFEDEVSRQYLLGSRASNAKQLELQYRLAVYIDGRNGDDGNDGTTADAPVKTLRRAYQALEGVGGSYLMVVDTVEVAADVTLTGNSYQESGSGNSSVKLSRGPVEIVRYARPAAARAFFGLLPAVNGFARESHEGTLFDVRSGTLALENVTLDGHRFAKSGEGTPPQLASAGVRASSALVRVGPAGSLDLMDGAVLRNNDNAVAAATTDLQLHGGAVNNLGRVSMMDARIEQCAAAKGAAVYHAGSRLQVDALQAATFGVQELWLASSGGEGSGWSDATLTVAAAIADDVVGDAAVHIEADRAVRERPAVSFISGAFEGDVADQAAHFKLGGSVHDKLSLGASPVRANSLELQDYQTLTVVKTWDVSRDWSRPLPESIELFVKNADETGDKVAFTAKVDVSGDLARCDRGSVAVDSPRKWTITLEGVPTYEGLGTTDEEITYEVEETAVEGVPLAESGFHASVVANAPRRFELTNTAELVGLVYDANGATGGAVPEAQRVPAGSHVDVRENDAEVPLCKHGAAFVGWNTRADGTGEHFDPGQMIEVASEPITLYAQWLEANLSSAILDESPFGPGSLVRYTVEVTVPEDSPDLTVSDALVPELEFVEGSASHEGSFNVLGKTLSWRLSDIPAGTKVSLSFDARVAESAPEGSLLRNHARIVCGATSLNTNEDALMTAGPAQVVVAADRKTVLPGDRITYTLQATNVSPVRSLPTVVRVYVPDLASYLSSSEGGEYDERSGSVTWLVPELEAGRSVDMTFAVKVDERLMPDDAIVCSAWYGSADPTASVSLADLPDPGRAANQVEVHSAVVLPADPAEPLDPDAPSEPAPVKPLPPALQAIIAQTGDSGALLTGFAVLLAAASLAAAVRLRRRRSA